MTQGGVSDVVDAVSENGSPLRRDLALIAEMIPPGSRVLDIGCAEGDLLHHLWHDKHIDGRGIELSQAGVHACVSRGLSVIQGDADTDLIDYPDLSFDYAVLSQTLQATRSPRDVLDNLVRIGRHAIVSVPNFGYWRVRLALLFRGRMPVTPNLPFSWFDTPNIHLCTISDLTALCADMEIIIERSLIMFPRGVAKPMAPQWLANLLGEGAIFLLKKAR
ncbi:MAG: methionine biosynthesis protein MetW [Alphaproteobacteria bacterium]|jgi:methionine biosynthesis protein MetW|nr:methionine biosynthesis protein MetW [Alphaproteobacteria bacterium]